MSTFLALGVVQGIVVKEGIAMAWIVWRGVVELGRRGTCHIGCPHGEEPLHKVAQERAPSTRRKNGAFGRCRSGKLEVKAANGTANNSIQGPNSARNRMNPWRVQPFIKHRKVLNTTYLGRISFWRRKISSFGISQCTGLTYRRTSGIVRKELLATSSQGRDERAGVETYEHDDWAGRKGGQASSLADSGKTAERDDRQNPSITAPSPRKKKSRSK